MRQIQTNKCVIASRYLKQSRWINKEPFFNRFVSRGFNILINLVLKLEVKDTQADMEKTKNDLGFVPEYDIRKGVKKMLSQ